MELKNNNEIENGLAEVQPRKSKKFHSLLLGAAVLFGINLLVAAFFYISPRFSGEAVRADDSFQSGAAKASAFERRVNESRWVPKRVEKVRPVVEAVPAAEPAGDETTAKPVDFPAESSSTFKNAVYSTETGARPVASAYRSESRDDGSSQAAAIAAAIAPRSTDLQ